MASIPLRRNLALAALWLSAASCSGRSQIGLHYRLDMIDPSEVVRVETVIAVDPADARKFFADQPYRAVAAGVGYEVRDLDGSGERKMLITFDSTIGYKFTPKFDFTLLPPDGEAAPPLIVTATAKGKTNDTIGVIQPIKTRFPGSVDLDIKDARCRGQACSGSTQQCCANVCAETATDVGNCGACGNACGIGGDTCTGTHCRCAGAAGCVAGASCCAGLGCIDLQTDNFNCGTCGHACDPGEVCAGGVCTCNGGAACPSTPDAVCCSGGCATGGCACGSAPCDAPNTCCGGSSCVNLGLDQNNCGSCGRACVAPFVCARGECTCNGTVCSNTDTCCPTGCHALADDPQNCGACGHACSAGELCVAGHCQCGTQTCGADQACCNGDCTPTNSDTQNCGACGHACQPGEQCANGACFCSTLPGGATQACLANQTCCSGTCFDLSSDSSHCGSCTKGCASGYACMMGMCSQTTCVPACSNRNQCVGTTCQCNGGPACGAPAQCCSSGCADLSNDFNNCGVCDRVCAAGETCSGGKCLRPDGAMCSASVQCLNGHCVDGYCCDSACNSACMACNVGGHLGECHPVAKDVLDPRMQCALTPPTTCGLDGRCDGNGGCQKWPGGTVCGAKTCDAKSNVATGAPTCDGSGRCNTPPSMSCAPYVCDGNTQACFTSCTTIAQCVLAVCSGQDAIVQPTCMTIGPSTQGRCVLGTNDCKPYRCQNGAPGQAAACASGACNNGCSDLMICATGCSCHINLLNCLLGAQCSCP